MQISELVVRNLVRTWRDNYTDLSETSVTLTNEILVAHIKNIAPPVNVMSQPVDVKPFGGLSPVFIESVYRLVVDALKDQQNMLLVHTQRILYLLRKRDG